MLSLFNCWTCDRRLAPGEVSEEYFFWCNKECYDKDDRYHNRQQNREEIARSKPEITSQAPTNEKEQRKLRIRETLAKINGKNKS